MCDVVYARWLTLYFPQARVGPAKRGANLGLRLRSTSTTDGAAKGIQGAARQSAGAEEIRAPRALSPEVFAPADR